MSKCYNRIPRLSNWSLLREVQPIGSVGFNETHKLKPLRLEKYGPLMRYPSKQNLVETYSAEDVGRLLRADSKWPLRPVLPLLDLAIRRKHLEPSISHLNGAKWAELRSKMQKIFLTPSAASQFYSQQMQVCESFIAALSNQNANNKVLSNQQQGDGILTNGNDCTIVTDFRSWACKFAAESVGRVLLGADMNSFTDDEKSPGARLCAAMDSLFTLTTQGLVQPPWSAWWQTKLYKEWLYQHQLSQQLVEELISAYGYRELWKYGRGSNSKKDVDRDLTLPHSFFTELLARQDLSEEEAVTFAVELFIAGVESAGNALTFLIYHLARHQDVQETLYKEVMSHVSADGHISVGAFSQLTYLKACLKESMRLSPPVTGTVRITTSDSLTLSGYSIPKGCIVNTASDTICHLEKYFHKPLDYDPERWLGERRASLTPFSYIPFGHGARMCIGRRFAEQELMMAAMIMVKEYKLALVKPSLKLDRILKVFYAPDQTVDVILYRR